MIKVEKDLSDIPSILTKKSREEVFDANVASSSYCDKKNKYKVGSVQNKLYEIYNLKCAYCERELLDAPKHIEHYRPKSTYYWLAYSWDNLFLCCGKCNSAKGKKFETKESAVVYNNEPFSDIHTLGKSYDILEKPKIINPEKEDVLDLIFFDKNAKIYSDDERVKHTIENVCNLNRDELIERRIRIINDFIKRMNGHYFYFKKTKDIEAFLPEIENFIEKCKKENEFYAFRYFILNNSDIFFENRLLQRIVKSLFSKLKPII